MTLVTRGVFFLVVHYMFPVIRGKAGNFWREETRKLKKLGEVVVVGENEPGDQEELEYGLGWCRCSTPD